MLQPQLAFRAPDLQTPQETIRQIRMQLRVAPEIHDYHVFYECFVRALGSDVTHAFVRFHYEQYACYCVLKDPVDYELPTEILCAIGFN